MNLSGDIIQDHPAFQIRKAVPKMHYGLKVKLPIFKAGDLVGLPFKGRGSEILHHWFRFGSIVSYALENDECPIASVKIAMDHIRAGRAEHKLHWLIPTGSMITAEKRAKETRVAIGWKDRLIFEGRIFEVVPEANGNAGLREVKGE